MNLGSKACWVRSRKTMRGWTALCKSLEIREIWSRVFVLWLFSMSKLVWFHWYINDYWIWCKSQLSAWGDAATDRDVWSTGAVYRIGMDVDEEIWSFVILYVMLIEANEIWRRLDVWGIPEEYSLMHTVPPDTLYYLSTYFGRMKLSEVAKNVSASK